MKTLIALLVLTASMAGCAIYTPGRPFARRHGDRGEARGHSFCPPGQEKKGNCGPRQ